MDLTNLKPQEGAKHYKKRVGRGIGSGMGKTATRGTKGQNSRTSGGVRTGYEGGQTMLFKRLPKRGFTSFKENDYVLVPLSKLQVFNDGETVDYKSLVDKKIIKDKNQKIKILGKGNIKAKIKVVANKFSQSAKESIISAGGEVEVV
jgi:large subunit ribosomal protein L15